MEKKIILPEGYELVESGNEYIVRKETLRPRTWKEFCQNNEIKPEECWININSDIIEIRCGYKRNPEANKNIYTSTKEAEAFLALMQLRQLRKAWVGDWKPNGKDNFFAINWDFREGALKTKLFTYSSKALSFPTLTMAEEFLECFKDLCKTAKILL